MIPFTPDTAAQKDTFPVCHQQSEDARGSTITAAFDDTVSPETAATHCSTSPPESSSCDMTVYYSYNDDGTLRSSLTLDPLIHPYPEQTASENYIHRGDIVGAYLVQRDILYAAYASTEAYGQMHRGGQLTHEQQPVTYVDLHDAGLRHKNEEQYDSYDSHYPDQIYSAGYIGSASHTKQYRAYADPENIRHLHSLQSLLPCIDPARRFNAFNGPTVDIVEEDTGTVFAYGVYKKLLVLFLGRNVVTKLLYTVGTFKDKRSRHNRKVQQLWIPRGFASTSAIKVLVSWMGRACSFNHKDKVKQFEVPKNTFTACTLAQTLNLFGLHKDALRVDHVLTGNHFVRPIYAVELATLWNCLGEKNRYVYAAIKVVGERLRVYEEGERKRVALQEGILQLLKQYPALKTRVRDLEFNETFRPTFSTD
jgi:hypothetical protein